MLTISAAITDADAVLAPAGELDLAAVDEIRCAAGSVLAAAQGKPLTVDLAAVSFIDAAGLGALVAVSNAAADAGTTLRLRSAPNHVAKLLDLTGLSGLLAEDERRR